MTIWLAFYIIVVVGLLTPGFLARQRYDTLGMLGSMFADLAIFSGVVGILLATKGRGAGFFYCAVVAILAGFIVRARMDRISIREGLKHGGGKRNKRR